MKVVAGGIDEHGISVDVAGAGVTALDITVCCLTDIPHFVTPENTIRKCASTSID